MPPRSTRQAGPTASRGRPGASSAGRLALAAGLLLGAVVPPAPGSHARQSPLDEPTETNRPATAGRVVAVFDFNERAVNPQPVPKDWFRAQHLPPERPRPGFPQYNAAAFDRAVLRDPQQSPGNNASVRLPTNGGSTSLRSASRAIPIFPGADYIVTGAVRTTPLAHARAFITARLLDAEAKPIEGAEFRSQPALSPDGWQLVPVRVPGRFPKAAYLQLDLELLQPEQAETARGGRHAVPAQDFNGSAWFDDVAVFQLPRLELSAIGGGGVLLPGEPAALKADIRDLAGEAITAQLTVTDLDDATVWEAQANLPAGGGELSWKPPLDRLGWYLATLRVYARDNLIGETTTTIVRVPQPTGPGRGVGGAPTGLGSGEADRTFRVAAQSVPAGSYRQLASLLARVGVRSAVVAAPAEALRPLTPGEPSPLEGTDFADGLGMLLMGGVELGVSIPRLPAPLAAELRVDPGEPRTLLALDPKGWLSSLQPMLDMFGQRVTWWQLGDDSGDALVRGLTDGRQSLRFRSLIAATVPAPQSVLSWRADLPWPADQRWGAGGADAVSVVLPWSFPAEAVPTLAAQWLAGGARDGGPGRGRSELSVVVQPPPHEEFGRRASVIELSRRAVLLWRDLALGWPEGTGPGGAQRPIVRLTLESPWHPADSWRGGLAPEAALPVWANLSQRMTGRTYAGDLSTGQDAGITALLFSPRQGAAPAVAARSTPPASPLSAATGNTGGGVIVAWSAGGPARLRGYLSPPGVPVRIVDIFGNASSVLPGADGAITLPLTETPVFVEGVDTELALFVAGFSVTPSLVSAVAAIHDHELVLVNPFPTRVTGDIALPQQQGPGPVAPGRQWRFSATAPIPFSIPPGGTARIPFSFSFPAQEEAGPRTIQAVVRLQASRTYPPMRLAAPIEIGLPDLDLQVATSRSPAPDGPDVVLLATVTNSGRASRTLRLDVIAPRQARQEQAISNLAPGESVLRRFVFPGGAASLRGSRLRATLTDVDGAERLNRSAPAP